MRSTSSAPLSRLDSSREYLAVVQALCVAVRDGIAALASNRLAEFNELLVQQEDLCSCLKQWERDLNSKSTSAQTLLPNADHDNLDLKRRTALHALATANRLYAAFLRHLTRSFELLSVHCKTYVDAHDAGEGRSSIRQA